MPFAPCLWLHLHTERGREVLTRYGMFWSLVLQFHSLQNGTEITPSNHNSKKAPKQLAIFSATDRLREDWVSAPLLPPPTPTPSSVTQLPLHLVWVVPGLGSAFPAAYDLGRMSPHTKMGSFYVSCVEAGQGN